MDYNVAKAIYNGLLEYCCDICDACNDNRFAAPLTKLLKVVLAVNKFPLTKKAIREKAEEINAKIERVKERPVFLSPRDRKNRGERGFRGERNSDRKKTSELRILWREMRERQEDEKEVSVLQIRRVLFPRLFATQSHAAPESLPVVATLSGAQTIFRSNCARGQGTLCHTPSKDLAPGISERFFHPVLFRGDRHGGGHAALSDATPEQYFQSYKILEDDVIAKTKQTFARNKDNGALTVSMTGFSEEGLSISLLTFPPDAAPTHGQFSPAVSQAFDTEKWTTAQRGVAEKSFRSPGDLKKLQSNRQLWTASIMKSMKP
eukprot:CAMPEP_0168211238 /NCGR_PEP_ID=MMETSP0140_2-20121125/3601_1 /TAXON_ID=44445 /ORGANISM="Pseudo-nitzschia australis, Strain 10249 10 AB" /LENGTH=318 /DNA_ID=CAMNT_0008137901 /DNA_START=317 /DNA_END=1274 /DNA_ORIENTATION=+